MHFLHTSRFYPYSSSSTLSVSSIICAVYVDWAKMSVYTLCNFQHNSSLKGAIAHLPTLKQGGERPTAKVYWGTHKSRGRWGRFADGFTEHIISVKNRLLDLSCEGRNGALRASEIHCVFHISAHEKPTSIKPKRHSSSNLYASNY